MAYVPTTFVDRSVEFPNRRKLTSVSGLADTFDVARAEGTVFVEGTKLDAANLNAEFGKISQSLTRRTVTHSFTIPANSYTSYTFTSAELTGSPFAVIGIQTFGADFVLTDFYTTNDKTIHITIRNLSSLNITRDVTVFYLSA